MIFKPLLTTSFAKKKHWLEVGGGMFFLRLEKVSMISRIYPEQDKLKDKTFLYG